MQIQQPREFDVILGRNNQPKSTDVVLGGKGAVERAIEGLRNPSSYEQAKRFLLAQPKVKQPLLDIKARSWDDIFQFYFDHIEVIVEKPSHCERYYGYVRPVAYYYFSIPEVEDNPITYHYRQDLNMAEFDIGHRVCFKTEKWRCSRLSQAFNFRYLVRRWGSEEVSIGNYWDSTRQKMILLP